MSKQDTSLDDISQSIADLGGMIDQRFNSVEKTLKNHGKTLKEQGVLMEDLTSKFDKNIDLLSDEMKVKKRVDEHDEQIENLQTNQKLIEKVVKSYSEQLAAK